MQKDIPMISNSWKAALQNRTDLQEYGSSNALALFALELRFQIEDIGTVATDSLTDGADDKKCDFIYLNKEHGHLVVIQSYESTRPKPSPSSNKAADLNTAVSWLFSCSIDKIPYRLRSTISYVREQLRESQIHDIQFWYVHNLPESIEVERELEAVEHSINNALNNCFPDIETPNIRALQVGEKKLEEWYTSIDSPILITDQFSVPITDGYELHGDQWSAFITTVPISWLFQIFQKHKDSIFSANVRGYLGSQKRQNNINNRIKESAQNQPESFWAFNNGITALVHDFKKTDESCLSAQDSSSQKLLIIEGISIINGAQTTGCIGSLDTSPGDLGKVQVRFVKCEDRDLIKKIIEYNNSQNAIEASDFRSNDRVQKRLRDEFQEYYPSYKYTGGRRGGFEDKIRRPGANLIPSDTVSQVLAAFHGDPTTAYNKSSSIWVNDKTYSTYFPDEITARHIVFVYSLLRSIESIKKELMTKKRENNLPDTEADQIDFLQQRGSHFLLITTISKSLEIINDCKIPQLFRASFKDHGIDPDRGKEIWRPIVETFLAFSTELMPAVSPSLSNDAKVNEVIGNFKRVIESTKRYHKPVYQEFSDRIILS